MTGTVHAVVTTEDSIVSGGHFLTPASMAQTLEMLALQEKNPNLVNDDQPVDIHKFHRMFIRGLCQGRRWDLEERAIARYCAVLKEYIEAETRLFSERVSQPENFLNDSEVLHHVKRQKFQAFARERWPRLMEVISRPDWTLQSTHLAKKPSMQLSRSFVELTPEANLPFEAGNDSDYSETVNRRSRKRKRAGIGK